MHETLVFIGSNKRFNVQYIDDKLLRNINALELESLGGYACRAQYITLNTQLKS